MRQKWFLVFLLVSVILALLSGCSETAPKPEAALWGHWAYAGGEGGSLGYAYNLSFQEDGVLTFLGRPQDQAAYVVIAPGRIKISMEGGDEVLNFLMEDDTLTLYFADGYNTYTRATETHATAQVELMEPTPTGVLTEPVSISTPTQESPTEEVIEQVIDEVYVITPTAEAPVVEDFWFDGFTGETVRVRWFVGLGAGSDEGTFAPQQAVVNEFNALQDKIHLVLEIVDNDTAFDVLATHIAAGNPPDIVGPVGIRGRDSFYGEWLDLTPYIQKYNYDLSDFDPALVEFYKVQEEGQLSIPFGVSPSFMIYNINLFDRAGLNYPPTHYGEPYIWPDGTKAEWNIDTLRELSMRLTLDANGNDATMNAFNPRNIVQFGFMNQWTDPRGIGTFFGAGSFLADDGVTAQIPEPWQAAWKWTYDGWWKDWFIPNGDYSRANFLQGPGGPFSSGNLAMIHIHLWYVAPWALGNVGFDWELAATPSYQGTITSKMHADTFSIPKGSKNPDAAFIVLTYLLSEDVVPKLLNVYGSMPARLSLQDAYFDEYTAVNFPAKRINWDVVVASMAYADNPNHESWMPFFFTTTDRYNEFWNYAANTPGLNLDAEMEVLRRDLQRIFDAAQ